MTRRRTRGQRWATRGPVGSSRSRARLDGGPYPRAGGNHAADNGQSYSDGATYDIGAQTWTATAPIPSAVADNQLAVYHEAWTGDRVIVVANRGLAGWPSDPRANAWTTLDVPPTLVSCEPAMIVQAGAVAEVVRSAPIGSRCCCCRASRRGAPLRCRQTHRRLRLRRCSGQESVSFSGGGNVNINSCLAIRPPADCDPTVPAVTYKNDGWVLIP